MPPGAPRLLPRPRMRPARGARLALGLWLAALAPGPAGAQQIESARFVGPATHYTHGVLGDAVEYSGMRVRLSDGRSFLVGFALGGRVFEDIAPRLWDVTGDGAPEIVVIETDPPRGAQLAVYGLRDNAIAKIAATPHIGRTHRWLAPIGAADLDGDGIIEIAYIDRPHLGKTLRIWRFHDGSLQHLADRPGLTNHKIGWGIIPGGIRTCGDRPELVTANADWSHVIATTYERGAVQTRTIAPYAGPSSLTAALSCP